MEDTIMAWHEAVSMAFECAANRTHDIVEHADHTLEVAHYGKPGHIGNVALECTDCYVVVADVDHPAMP